MSPYGVAPASDQVEVTIFGPGCGEAVALHLGDNQWLLVDSCLHPSNHEPATLDYLQNIGVSTDAVKLIVASHWHDDHIRGIAALTEACKNAIFFLSGVFMREEAQTFLATYSGKEAPSQTRGTKELSKVLSKFDVIPATQFTLLDQITAAGRTVRICSLSPTHEAQIHWVRGMAQYIPRQDQSPINLAPQLRPNHAAVALHVDFGGVDAVILGADLENHEEFGWPAVLRDRRSKTLTKGSAYKVAHHGSRNAHTDALWSNLLLNKPVASVTPFTRSNLPTDDDRHRIRALASEAFITSNRSKRPEIDRSQLKRMQAICTNLAKVDTGFGAIRLRKRAGEAAWVPELFGHAGRL